MAGQNKGKEEKSRHDRIRQGQEKTRAGQGRI